MRDDKVITAAVRIDLEGDILTSLEDWRRAQPKIPSRTEALRHMVERGLQAEQELHTAA
jgi:hypothetical protein